MNVQVLRTDQQIADELRATLNALAALMTEAKKRDIRVNFSIVAPTEKGPFVPAATIEKIASL